MTESHLHLMVERLMSGEALPTHQSPELPAVLAEVRAAIHDQRAQQLLGWRVMKLLMSNIKANIHSEQTLVRVMNKDDGNE